MQKISDLIRALRASSLEFKATILLLVILTPLSVAAIIFALLTVTLHVTPILAAPPLEFSSGEYAPTKNPICAGEQVEYTFAVSVNAPYTSVIARAVYKERAPGEWERVYALPVEISPIRHSFAMQEITRVIPGSEDLPPGNYLFEQNVQTLYSAPIGFSVPFRVIECAK